MGILDVLALPVFLMESERQTRKRRIDPLLKSLGWQVVPFTEDCSLADLNNCAIEEFPTENGPADYALCIDGRIMGKRGSRILGIC